MVGLFSCEVGRFKILRYQDVASFELILVSMKLRKLTGTSVFYFTNIVCDQMFAFEPVSESI